MAFDFKRIQQRAAADGVEAALADAADELAAAGAIHELFEIRLVQARRRLGLPAISPGGWDGLEPEQRDALEQEYLVACGEASERLIAAGRLTEAWQYVRPSGETDRLAAALEAAPVDAENVGELIELALQEGVAPLHGFGLLLEHYGVCNAITAFDGAIRGRDAELAAQAATLLVRRLYDDLIGNIRTDLARRDGAEPAEGATLEALVAARDDLFADGAYHVDVSHLASVVRFARGIRDREVLALARELCSYGRRLDPQFQYGGEEPFADYYPAHALYFDAQLGGDAEAAVAYFRQRADQFTPRDHGPEPAEVFVGLLARLGRHEEAMEEADLRWEAARTGLDARLLWTLASESGRYDVLQRLARRRGDVAAFAAALAAGASGVSRK